MGLGNRTVIDRYLRLLRLPIDLAISMLPDVGTGVRPAARAAVDRTDAVVRATLGIDPAAGADIERVADEAHDREEVTVDPAILSETSRSEQKASTPRVGSQRRPVRNGTNADGRERAARPHRQPAAAAAMARVDERIPPNHASGAHNGDDVAIAEQKQTDTPISSDSRAPLSDHHRSPSEKTSRTPAPTRTTGPSHEAIAALAYELYERGEPGDAATHWRIAETELTSSS